jgi:hypothetical protein
MCCFPLIVNCNILKMAANKSSETLLNIYNSHGIIFNFHQHRCEHLQSRTHCVLIYKHRDKLQTNHLRAALLMHHSLQFIATLSKTKRLINPLSQKTLRNTRVRQSSKSDIRTEQNKQGMQRYRTFASVFLYIFLDSLTL